MLVNRITTLVSSQAVRGTTLRCIGARAAYSTNGQDFKVTDTEIQIGDKNYKKDAWTNVSPTTLSRVNRKLHLHPQHPISIIRQLIESHFHDFKPFNEFSPVVTTKQNFDDLLIAKDHVTRNRSDNYYINESTMLRAHTSAHQLQGMRSGANKFLISGDVFRRDEIDASHYPVFHQMEGVVFFDADPVKTAEQVNADIASGRLKEAENVKVVDDTIVKPENPMQACHTPETLEPIAAHLKYSINSMLWKLFADEQDLEVRWIDAYFPFTSPSWEVEIKYKGEWLEVLGCGVVQQELMNQAGLHDKIGHAFGLGLERLAMVLFGIPDIRLFWSQDERFIQQFTPGKIQKFQPFSKYPPCIKDMSFWLPTKSWEENDFCELVRDVAGDLVENVELIDDFTHPKSQKRSLCYRILYRSMDRNVTNEEINTIQDRVRGAVEKQFAVELR
ncbi:phenylalanyl-tRNA synthetase [Zychaea mexicana]|uniref:phenylalanyl-tRNA synthetase n=1 Tax=Zychaea mexicana TaxID=64656 RepID=UPI0022FF3984|nr:phenylalanyl-tRNA synthetase [Zychaea mexicana]KAI9497314.1 phenylalanyl-tRNA synthetase [Zychaea mexicana]